ncbi:hypothetical protein PVAP13_8KG380102 [Panicum virgatum]|uniref:Uncharacterized protein n=1 Tax=Panicum virgatum TaxID=38727 RepID=A0A8T0PNS9_PANVG|nr:hypothetical protein PVAP13_8KG380102 [Panicum virgatum]
MPKWYSLHLHLLTLNTEPSPSVLGGIADKVGDDARRALSSPCPAARCPLSPSSSFSNDQRRRSPFSSSSRMRTPTGFLRLPPQRPSDVPEREEAKAAGRARRHAAPPLPPSAASPSPPLRRRATWRPFPTSLHGKPRPRLSAGKPHGSSSASLGVDRIRCHGVDIQT